METQTSTRRLPDGESLLTAIGSVVLVNVVGSLPGVFFSSDTAWFRNLEKPWFYPPDIAFPVVWTLLFTLLGVALWLVWRSDVDGRRLALGLFVAQMAFNVAWSARNYVPRQFERTSSARKRRPFSRSRRHCSPSGSFSCSGCSSRLPSPRSDG